MYTEIHQYVGSKLDWYIDWSQCCVPNNAYKEAVEALVELLSLVDRVHVHKDVDAR